MCFKELHNTNPSFALWAAHKPSSNNTPAPSAAVCKVLLDAPKTESRFAPRIELAIGSRVQLVKNLLTVQGAFNGTNGTVAGFAFRGGLPSKTHPSSSEVARTPNY